MNTVQEAIDAINLVKIEEFDIDNYYLFLTAIDKLKERKKKHEFTKYKLGLVIARLIINGAIKRNSPVSSMNLQRLLYLVYREGVIKQIPNIEKTMMFEAWKNAPIFKIVYDEYCLYGASTPLMVVEEIQPQDFELVPYGIIKIIDTILEENLKKPYFELTNEIQKESAFAKAWKKGRGTIIDPKDIKK